MLISSVFIFSVVIGEVSAGQGEKTNFTAKKKDKMDITKTSQEMSKGTLESTIKGLYSKIKRKFQGKSKGSSAAKEEAERELTIVERTKKRRRERDATEEKRATSRIVPHGLIKSEDDKD